MKRILAVLVLMTSLVLAAAPSGGTHSGGVMSGGTGSGGVWGGESGETGSGGLSSGGVMSGGAASGGAVGGGVTPPPTMSGGAESGGAVVPPQVEPPETQAPDRAPEETPTPASEYQHVVRVIDGDTAVFLVGDVPESVRFLSMDTPEVQGNEPFNKEATAYTKELLQNPVKLIFLPGGPTRDRFERLLAWLELPDGRTVNLLLVEAGLAVPFMTSPFQGDTVLYNAAAEGAQSVAKGIWFRRADYPFLDRNCRDFSTQSQAQAFFDGATTPQKRDPHRLDGDGDGVVCQGLTP